MNGGLWGAGGGLCLSGLGDLVRESGLRGFPPPSPRGQALRGNDGRKVRDSTQERGKMTGGTAGIHAREGAEVMGRGVGMMGEKLTEGYEGQGKGAMQGTGWPFDFVARSTQPPRSVAWRLC